MDKLNVKILKILQEKARIPNIEVSRKINLAPSAVLERMRKMESGGIIDGYEVRLNPKRFNCSQIAFIQILISPHFDITAIGSALSRIEEIQEVHFIAGEDCYLLKTRTAGTAELERLLREKILTIKGIRGSRTLPVLSTAKETARIPIR